MNYKVNKYRDLLEEEKLERRNYAVAAACLLGISACGLMHTQNETSMLYLEALSRFPVAVSLISAEAGLICLNKANNIKERTLTK